MRASDKVDFCNVQRKVGHVDIRLREEGTVDIRFEKKPTLVFAVCIVAVEVS